MNEYNVRIVLSELTIVAESQERAKEIAMEIYEADAHTKLHNGLVIEDCEVDDLGPSDETKETDP